MKICWKSHEWKQPYLDSLPSKFLESFLFRRQKFYCSRERYAFSVVRTWDDLRSSSSSDLMLADVLQRRCWRSSSSTFGASRSSDASAHTKIAFVVFPSPLHVRQRTNLPPRNWSAQVNMFLLLSFHFNESCIIFWTWKLTQTTDTLIMKTNRHLIKYTIQKYFIKILFYNSFILDYLIMINSFQILTTNNIKNQVKKNL